MNFQKWELFSGSSGIFLTLQFTWVVASLNFLKDDRLTFYLIKEQNRMTFDCNFLAFLATSQT